jgi:hypothetical protein
LVSDRIIQTRIKVLNINLKIVVLYGLVEGKEQETEEFYREPQQRMDKIPKRTRLF